MASWTGGLQRQGVIESTKPTTEMPVVSDPMRMHLQTAKVPEKVIDGLVQAEAAIKGQLDKGWSLGGYQRFDSSEDGQAFILSLLIDKPAKVLLMKISIPFDQTYKKERSCVYAYHYINHVLDCCPPESALYRLPRF